jgi:hypothetical protein
MEAVNFVMRIIAELGVDRASALLNQVIGDHNRAVRGLKTGDYYHINTSNYSDNQCIFTQWLSPGDGYVHALDLSPEVAHPYRGETQ